MQKQRLLVAPLTALLFGSLTCAVTPATPPVASAGRVEQTPPLAAAALSPELPDVAAAAPALWTPGSAARVATASLTHQAPGLDADAAITEAVLGHIVRYRRRSQLSDEELVELAHTIVREARRHDLDPALVVAVMHVESRFDAFAVSTADALGLMQLLPSTGAWMAPQVGVEWRGPHTLFDPTSNVRLGVAYLRQLVDRYDGSIRTALLAYNWGPGRIDRRLRRGVPLPREYAQLVFDAYGVRDSSS